MLNDSQLRHLCEEGYLRLGRVISDGQLAALQQRLDDLTQGRIRNEKIGFQLERAARVRMGKPKAYDWFGPSLSYRKLLHMDQDPLFLKYFSHPTFCSIMRQLIGPESPTTGRTGGLRKAPKRGHWGELYSKLNSP